MKPSLIRSFGYAAVFAAVPLVTFAQTSNTGTAGSTGTIEGLFQFVLTMINDYLVPLIFAIGFVVFLIGIYRYFIAGGGNEEQVATGRNFLLWSLIGFAIMVSVWGLVNLFVDTLGFNTQNQPQIPTFQTTTTSNSYNDTVDGTAATQQSI